jgi:hypothetical protein
MKFLMKSIIVLMRMLRLFTNVYTLLIVLSLKLMGILDWSAYGLISLGILSGFFVFATIQLAAIAKSEDIKFEDFEKEYGFEARFNAAPTINKHHE